MPEPIGHIAVLTLRLFLPDVHSLKEKRSIIQRFKANVCNKFKNISVAEIGDQDKWQSCIIGMCAIASDHKHLNQQMQTIQRHCDGFYDGEIVESCLEFV